MKILWVSIAFLLVFVLGSCGPSQSVSEQSPPSSQLDTPIYVSLTRIPVSNSPESSLQLTDTPEIIEAPPAELNLDNLVDLAKQDLAGRLKIDVTQIGLLKTMEITWPDVSQGCSPSSGQILPKGRVYGYRIWLEADGENYIYHTALTGQIFPCPQPNRGANNPLLMTPGGPTPGYQDQGP